MKKKDNTPTKELEELLMNTDDISSILNKVDTHFIGIKPGKYLMKVIATQNLSNKDMLRQLNISTSYFYEILNGSKLPGRDIFIQFLIAAGCGLDDSNTALRSCGYCPLYSRNKRDAVIIYSVSRNMSLFDTNILLESLSLPPLA